MAQEFLARARRKRFLQFTAHPQHYGMEIHQKHTSPSMIKVEYYENLGRPMGGNACVWFFRRNHDVQCYHLGHDGAYPSTAWMEEPEKAMSFTTFFNHSFVFSRYKITLSFYEKSRKFAIFPINPRRLLEEIF